MITTLLLDVGGTIYIKNNQGLGEINPAITYLLEKIPSTVQIVIVSDTETFDIEELMHKDLPRLESSNIFSKKLYPWIDKTQPETYSRICNELHTTPMSCVFIDNQSDFRSAAEKSGIKTFGITQGEIESCLTLLIK